MLRILNSQVISNLDDLVAVLMANREVDAASEFLKPISPLDLAAVSLGIDEAELAKAKQLLFDAYQAQKPILVFGDYDADGVIATVILVRTLRQMGIDVEWFVPSREKHGYGLNPTSFKDATAKFSQPGLIITVDNGIVAHPAIELAHQTGWQVIVTDHHQSDGVKPMADALIHTTQLCGAGVSWIFSREISGENLAELLPLVTIATLADQMKLLNVNRAIVWHGLKSINGTQIPGLKQLITNANLVNPVATTRDVNFGIAPRINAAGRMGEASRAVELLLASDAVQVEELAREIEQDNQRRQGLTTQISSSLLTDTASLKNDHIIMVASEQYPEGIIGLIAGKLVEAYLKPAIVCNISNGLVKCSARSIPGVNITQILRQYGHLMESVGGHELAAGFSCKLENLVAVQTALKNHDLELPAQLEMDIWVDALLHPDLINVNAVHQLQKFEPFGQGNYEPTFLIDDLVPKTIRPIGKEKKHLEITFQHGQKKVRGLWWNANQPSLPSMDEKWRVVAGLQLSSWQGKEYLELNIKHIVKS